jgi:ribosome maturation factor RimP
LVFWWALRAPFCLGPKVIGVTTDLRSRLMDLIEPLLVQLGYELADLELAAGRVHAQVRVFIDASAGVGIEDCERVSHEVSALLDVRDPIPTAYTLEVSTPGLDRVLRTPEHFARFAGSRVHVELLAPRDGRKRYTGKLVAAGASGIELEVDGVQVNVGYVDIGRARLVPDWPDTRRRR